MAEDFVVTRTATNGRVDVLRLAGRLDSRGAAELLARGAEVAALGRNLVLNLADVSLMSSSGLGALLALTEQFHEQAGEVRLAELSPTVKAVFELLDVEGVVNIDPDEITALKALNAV